MKWTLRQNAVSIKLKWQCPTCKHGWAPVPQPATRGQSSTLHPVKTRSSGSNISFSKPWKFTNLHFRPAAESSIWCFTAECGCHGYSRSWKQEVPLWLWQWQSQNVNIQKPFNCCWMFFWSSSEAQRLLLRLNPAQREHFNCNTISGSLIREWAPVAALRPLAAC